MPVAPPVSGHPAHRGNQSPNGHPHRDGAEFPVGKKQQTNKNNREKKASEKLAAQKTAV